MNIGEFEHRLLLAFVLGTLIGLERQWRHKIAGVKTNALVAGGAALFILVSEKITGDTSSASRIAANIVTGIGFLGAGIMMRNGTNITGINTAATIWCSAAIGTLAGLGYWYESLVGTAFVVLGNIILRPLGEKIDHRISNIKASGNMYVLEIAVLNEEEINNMRTLLSNEIEACPTLHISHIKVAYSGVIVAEINSLDKRKSDIQQIIQTLEKNHKLKHYALHEKHLNEAN